MTGVDSLAYSFPVLPLEERMLAFKKYRRKRRLLLGKEYERGWKVLADRELETSKDFSRLQKGVWVVAPQYPHFYLR